MLAVTFCLLNSLSAVDVPWDTARLRLDDTGRLASLSIGGREAGVPGTPFCRLQTADGLLDPTSATQQGGQVAVGFPGGAVLVYRVKAGPGHVWFDLAEVRGMALERVEAVRICDVNVEGLPASRGVLNAAHDEHDTVAVMAAKVNVHTLIASMGQRGSSFDKCRHSFLPETERVKQGKRAGRFSAASEREDNDGWAYRGRAVTPALDLTGLQAIKAWVHGDGNGQLLKIQLSDHKGYRDDYVRIDFTGWREVTLDRPQLNTIDPAHVRALGIYYNLLPGRMSVECLIDSIRAVVDGREVMLEDFEAIDGELWDGRGTALRAVTSRDHGLLPAGFGLVACPNDQFDGAIDAFERAAGLPHPRPGGGGHSGSPWSKRSYLFITSFGEADTDQVIAWARRGAMPMVLIGAGSWNVTCGTHAVNEGYFPGGLPSLQRTADKLHQAGLRVGLHFLAAAVYPNDPLVRPKPDPRLFKGARLALAADLDDKAALIPTDAAPTAFPEEDGGYLGDGTYLQIDDELIQYGARQLTPPYGFAGCVRGANGTVATAHAKGPTPRARRWPTSCAPTATSCSTWGARWPTR
ncbi:MAG: hypothetical protein HYU66_12445 [Armatimonadetes bacterium]|nr:hypothetical protein [Armatimonadota bacterium]